MPFPNLNDKSLKLTQNKLDNYKPSNSYREKVIEKIQNSPRNNSQAFQKTIDLSLNKEKTFIRPSSRLRFSNDKLNIPNDDSDDYLSTQKQTQNEAPVARPRQIVYYNKTYVPSSSDTNNATEIKDDDDLLSESFNRNLENLRRQQNNISRPNSRESFYQDNTRLKLRSKSSYIKRNTSSPRENIFSNNFDDDSNVYIPNSNNRIKKNDNFMNKFSLNIENSTNSFDSISTKSIDDFKFASVSKTSFNNEDESKKPVPKPRTRNTLNSSTKLSLNLNDTDSFKIKRNNQTISGRVVTPRINYVPTPRTTNNNNENQSWDLDNNKDKVYNLNRSVSRRSTRLNNDSFNFEND